SFFRKKKQNIYNTLTFFLSAMRVRKFRKEDAQKASNIIKRNLLEVNSKKYTKATVNALIKDSTPARLIEKSKTRHYYIAIENEQILGIGGYEEANLHTFFVKPKIHGKGVGKRLMERVLKDAKKEGVKIMHCASTHYADKFYASFGFKRIREKTVPFYGTTLTFVQMKKRL
ncbi:GNAT family N-acetyltransferase, partial [Candidatus Woesearchaeota archaeon]|nr:GNAT family N-acetyltransferase [Candidatus Woesearchaeota archaeon]